MSKKLKEGTLKDFSELVVRVARLPRGTELQFKYVKKDRRVRTDFAIKRRGVNSKTLQIPEDGERVSDFLIRVRELVSTDLAVKGIEMHLLTPTGALVHGNTQIGAIRAEPGLPGSDDGEAVLLFAQMLENALPDNEYTLLELRELFAEFSDSLGAEFEELLRKARARILAKKKKPKK